MRWLIEAAVLSLGVVSGAQTSSAPSARGALPENASHDLQGTAVSFRGYVNRQNVERLKSTIHELKSTSEDSDFWLVIESPGGDAGSLIELSNFVDREMRGVVVRGRCSSACAELLLTIERQVILSKRAEIRFHMNPLMGILLLRERGISPDKCGIARSQWYIDNFNARLSPWAFTQDVMNYLAFDRGHTPTVVGNGVCRDYIFRSRNSFFVIDNHYLEDITDRRIKIWEG